MSEARAIELDGVRMRVTPRFGGSGSILADTVKNRLVDIETALEIESTAPKEDVAKLVATAERMCYMMDVIRQPHEVRASVTLNGEPLDGRTL
ncbi:MAG: hypothetical protein ACRDJE_16615 [Dehalococcoidia bacterium]